jgi:hypothetical protein
MTPNKMEIGIMMSLKNLVTLCENHHKETFRNNYAGLELIDRHIQLGIQTVLTQPKSQGS